MRQLTALFVVCALLLGSVAPSAAKPRDRAVATTEQLVRAAHTALSSGDLEILVNAVERAFDFDVWVVFLLKNRAEHFDERQRLTIRSLLPRYMASLYRKQFDQGLRQIPRIGKPRRVRRNILVPTHFQRANGLELPVVWRHSRTRGKGWSIIDIMVGGASLVILKREEFTAIIDRAGPEGLIDFLRRNSL